MSERQLRKRREHSALIRHNSEVIWENPPEHYGGAISKMLVRPENSSSRLMDFRISCYQPMAHVTVHSHRRQEQIYYILEGEGLMEISGERTVVRPQTTIFLPPGVDHAIHNTGAVDLVFLVITTPPYDE